MPRARPKIQEGVAVPRACPKPQIKNGLSTSLGPLMRFFNFLDARKTITASRQLVILATASEMGEGKGSSQWSVPAPPPKTETRDRRGVTPAEAGVQ